MDFPPVDIGPTKVISSHSGVLIKEKDFQHRLRKTSIYVYGTEYYEASEVNRCIAHHKYRRCLDMAEKCRLEQERIELIECQDITDDDFDKLAKGFYKKWQKRWLELAEKFK